MKKTVRMVLITALLAASGCMAVEIQTPSGAASEQNRQVYEIYRSYMESENQVREESGLPPRRIKPFEEWRQAPGTD